jgi:WD40-like Beta Propeller Repeat
MRRERDRELERRLRDLPLPDEAEAEERSWEVVRAAYEERTPVRPTYRARRLALALAAGAVLLAIGLSPAGAQMSDWVRDVVGEEDAKPELTSLPTAGELLVQADGVWIVRADGSQRRLGDYDEASWSPRGLFVVATDESFISAVDPAGEVRWKVPAPNAHDPRWGGTGSDTRIAYRSEGDLWVVAGDGTDKRLIARDVAPVPPAWRPLLPEAKAQAPPEGFAVVHLLTYVDGDRRTHTVDVDTDRTVPTTRQDLERLSAPPSGGPANRAFSPDGRSFAVVERVRGRDQLVLMHRNERGKQVLFSALGDLTGPTWSPDGRWILVGWPEADQWVFIRTDQECLKRPDLPRCVDAIGDISAQFESGDNGGTGFPRVAGWVLPQR